MSCPHSPTTTHDAGTCPAVRPELRQPLPPRMRKLSVDARGYPVPWFVHWLPDGTPEHRAMDTKKWPRAVHERLCWTCGEPMGKFLTFVIGPMCGVNRTTAEPASHLDCAIWSAQNCPFLSRPHATRRDVDTTQERFAHLRTDPAGIGIARNPGVTLLWTTMTFYQWRPSARNRADCPAINDGPLLHIGDPIAIRAFAEGREATRAEIDESTRTGLPALLEVAELQGDAAIKELLAAMTTFAKTLDAFVA